MQAAVRRLVSFSSLVLLASCVSLKPMHTPSGSPEIVVRGGQPAEILDDLSLAMSIRGYREVMQSERLAIFTKPCDDFDTAFFYGKGWNSSADFRVTLIMDRAETGVRVVIDMEIVTEAGTPKEASKPAPQGHPEAHELQDMLEYLVADLALRRHEEQWPDEPERPAQSAVWTGEN